MKLFERFPEAKFINQSQRDFKWYGGKPTGKGEIAETAAINDAVIDLTGGVVIKDGVHFGREVMILTCSHPTFILDGMERRKALICEKVYIDNDAYIGSRATILPGVLIGQGAYVAAGAVVTEDVKPFTLVAGVPAKKIRKLEATGE